MKQTTAIFPGTFDPFTNGHLSVLLRALNLFERVIIGVGNNKAKLNWLSLDKRILIIQTLIKTQVLNYVSVQAIEGTTAQWAHDQKVTVLIRGVRNTQDFSFEMQMAQINRHLNHELETIILFPEQHLMNLSSSVVRELFHAGADIQSFVPKEVMNALAQNKQ